MNRIASCALSLIFLSCKDSGENTINPESTKTYDDGYIISKGHEINGQKDGVWYYYLKNSDSTLLYNQNYKNGILLTRTNYYLGQESYRDIYTDSNTFYSKVLNKRLFYYEIFGYDPNINQVDIHSGKRIFDHNCYSCHYEYEQFMKVQFNDSIHFSELWHIRSPKLINFDSLWFFNHRTKHDIFGFLDSIAFVSLSEYIEYNRW